MGKGQISISKLVSIILVFCLFLPYVLLVYFGVQLDLVPINELLVVLQDSMTQATLSAAISLALGFLGALGFVSLKSRRLIKGLSLLCVLPGFLPVLFVAVSVMTLVESLSVQVSSLTSIVFCHVVMNAGIVANAFYITINAEHGKHFELAASLGLPRARFYNSVLLPLLKKDFFVLFLFVFSICFTSFTVPHIFSSFKSYSFEAFIFQKLRLEGEVGQALFLSLLQSAAIFLMVYLFYPKYQVAKLSYRKVKVFCRYGVKLAYLPLIAFTSLVLVSELGSVLVRAHQLDMPWAHLLQPTVGTLSIAVTTFLLMSFSLRAVAFAISVRDFQKLLLYYVPPGAVFLGLLAILLGLDRFVLILVPVLFVLSTLQIVYKLGFYTRLKSLKKQVEVGRTLGLSDFKMYKKIVAPQVVGLSYFLAGVSAFWVVGEYTLSVVIATSDVSLSLWIKSMLKSYKFAEASVLNLFIFLIGMVFFLIGERLRDVFDQKLK